MTRQPIKRTASRNSVPAPRASKAVSGSYSVVNSPAPAPSKEEVLDLLAKMHAVKLAAKSEDERYYDPQTPLERRCMHAAHDLGYVTARGAKRYISQLGIKYLNEERGAPYSTLLRATSREVYAANLFKQAANQAANLGDLDGVGMSLEDVVRIWASVLPFEAFAALRGLGVELGLAGDDAAAEMMRRLVGNLHPARLSGIRRDRVKAELFAPIPEAGA